jgi:hypothetical protein
LYMKIKFLILDDTTLSFPEKLDTKVKLRFEV